MTAFWRNWIGKTGAYPIIFHELSTVSGLLFLSDQYRQKPAGMVGSGAFFGSRRAGGCGVPAFSQDGSGWFFTGFPIGHRNGFLDMCGCLLYCAAGMVVPNPAQSAPAVPVEAIGKTKIANSPVSRFFTLNPTPACLTTSPVVASFLTA